MAVRYRERRTSRHDINALTQALHVENERTTRLLEGPTEAEDPATLREALDALRLHHEELLVAEEELRAQVDALTHTSLALEAEREKYSELFELAPDACVVTNLEGVIIEANHAAADVFHIERRFLRSKPLSILLQPSSSAAFDVLLDAMGAGSESRVVTLTLKPRGGGEPLVEAHVAMSSRGHRLLWILRRRDLPILASDPSGDLARALRDKEDLFQRERRLRSDLERANRAKDRFIAILAHDLRAPLNAILGWTQLLQREALDHQGRARAYATIERNARAQGELIEELLDISRLAADKVQLSFASHDLALLARRVCEASKAKAAELGVQLTCSAEEGIAVIGDRQRLEQILANLLTNALEFTPFGGRVDVDVVRDGRRAKLTVKDTGRGIRAEAIPHVFETYMQERERATARSGLGLGASTS